MNDGITVAAVMAGVMLAIKIISFFIDKAKSKEPPPWAEDIKKAAETINALEMFDWRAKDIENHEWHSIVDSDGVKKWIFRDDVVQNIRETAANNRGRLLLTTERC